MISQLDWAFQTHLLRSRPPTSTMKKTSMPGLTRRRWRKPSTNSCSSWRSKRRRASRTWSHYCQVAQACTRVLSLHVCARGYGGWFSPSTVRRSGQYVYLAGVAPVPTRSGSQVINQIYPGLSQFIWCYPWPVNSTILVLLLLENCFIQPNELCFFGVH